MLIATIALAATIAQQPAQAPSEVPLLNVSLGSCSASFTVTNAEGTPAYATAIGVKIRYGPMGLKRMELEMSTNSDGKATIQGLPSKAKPLTYEIFKANRSAVVEQDLAKKCQSAFDVSLKWRSARQRTGLTQA